MLYIVHVVIFTCVMHNVVLGIFLSPLKCLGTRLLREWLEKEDPRKRGGYHRIYIVQYRVSALPSFYSSWSGSALMLLYNTYILLVEGGGV